MKLIKLLTVAACAFALVSGSTLAQEKTEKKLKGKIVAGSCCDKAKKADKTCTHPCCVAAAKDGKVCEKCNKKKSKKEESK